jgi:hypothetical protein
MNTDDDGTVTKILIAVLEERRRQNEIFGPFAGFDDDPPHVKQTVLAKKLADYMVAIAQEDAYFGHLRTRTARQELIELTAVCVALLEETA